MRRIIRQKSAFTSWNNIKYNAYTYEYGDYFMAKIIEDITNYRERRTTDKEKYNSNCNDSKNVIWTRMGKDLTEISNYYKFFFFIRENQFVLNCFARE